MMLREYVVDGNVCDVQQNLQAGR